MTATVDADADADADTDADAGSKAGTDSKTDVGSYAGADETTLIPMVLRPTVREELGRPVVSKTDRRIVLVLTVIAIVFSISAYGYYASHHVTMAIKDSFSHLEIGRRVVSGTTPGIAQLGGVWLPLPHVLQTMLAWNPYLYRTGLSGALISMVAYVVSSQSIFRIVRIYDSARVWPAVVAAMVFMTNPNVLYMQSTSMDELPFFACTLVAIFYLLRWATTERPTSLMASGLASFAAMLCRYEAWFLGVLYVVAVVVITRRNGHNWRDVRGLALVAAVFGVVCAAAGWFLYNWAIFGSPLNFLTGTESASQQMAGRTDAEIGHWTVALHGYSTAVIANVGLAVLIAAGLGLALLLWRERLSARSLPLLCLVPLLAFHLYAIESGQFPFGVPEINNDLDNLRFGLPPIVPAALLTGYLLSQWPTGGKLRVPGWIPAVVASVALVAIGGSAIMRHQVAIAAEAANDVTYLSLQAEVGKVLQDQTHGPILMNAYGNEKVLFPVLDRVIYEGSKTTHDNLWFRSLDAPAASGIQVIVMRFAGPTADAVFLRLHDSPLLRDYRLLLQNGQYLVYVRK